MEKFKKQWKYFKARLGNSVCEIELTKDDAKKLWDLSKQIVPDRRIHHIEVNFNKNIDEQVEHARELIKAGIQPKNCTTEIIDYNSEQIKLFHALCKETLGRIRAKYKSIPTPNGEVSTFEDAQNLINEAREVLTFYKL